MLSAKVLMILNTKCPQPSTKTNLQVSTSELAEVFAINVIAPTMLNARLKGLMECTTAPDGYEERVRARGGGAGMPSGKGTRDPHSHEPWLKFVVNVSAMEGRFYRYYARDPHSLPHSLSLSRRHGCSIVCISVLPSRGPPHPLH